MGTYFDTSYGKCCANQNECPHFKSFFPPFIVIGAGAKMLKIMRKKALPVTFPNGDGEPFESSSPKLL
jgi:hypothetical protein